MKHLLSALTLVAVISSARADWAAKDDANPDLPGRKVDITQDGVLRARLIYGEGQIKPYLRVQGEEGDGLNEWSEKQQFPHHRGIYIGWNKIISDLGSFDLWHMNNYAGPSMGLKVPEYKTTFSLTPLHFSHEQAGGMICVGPDGGRFCDEKLRTMHGKIKK